MIDTIKDVKEIIEYKNKVHFISYDGEYPNLCSGTLVLQYRGKDYKFNHLITSGGSATIYEDYDEDVTHDEWSIAVNDLPEELKSKADDIRYLVNSNVEYGCCGGCL